MPLPLASELYYQLVMTRAGVLPQSPADLRAQLVNLITFGTDKDGNVVLTPMPGFTANLPGSLVEDVVSTGTGALIVSDQAKVELINSLTPYGANAFLCAQLGQLFGIPFGTTTNVSVDLTFSGTVGFLIPRGFVVGDGQHTYVVQTAGVIKANGQSEKLTAVSPSAGSWAAPAGTVTQIVTSVPGSITLTVTNALQGTGGNEQETEQAYRLRIMEAAVVGCQGTPAMIKTLLKAIPGVVPQQVAVQGIVGDFWKVICGGSNPDPYAIAEALYRSVPTTG